MTNASNLPASMSAPLAPLVAAWKKSSYSAPGRIVVPEPLRAFFLAGLFDQSDRHVIAVVPSDNEADSLADDLALFVDSPLLLPAWETLPFEMVSPATATMGRRAEVRHALSKGEPRVVVASVRAFTQRPSPSSVAPVSFSAGAELDLDKMIDRLVDMGYERTHQVEVRGEFAVRGGVVDLFAAQADTPARVELWGDEIESVRELSVVTQRSGTDIALLEAFPAREFRPDQAVQEASGRLVFEAGWAAHIWERLAGGQSFEGMESWMGWLSDPAVLLNGVDDAAVIVFDPIVAEQRSVELIEEEADLAAALAPTWGPEAPQAGDHPEFYQPLKRVLAAVDVLDSPPLPAGPEDQTLRVRGFDPGGSDASAIAKAVGKLHDSGLHVVLAMEGAHAADRAARILSEEGIDLPRRQALSEPMSAVVAQPINRGFVSSDLGVALLGEQEVAGRRHVRRRSRPRGSATVKFQDLTVGDYVIHAHHGIGLFEGLVTQEMAGIERDYLVLAFAGKDKLYVATDQLDAITRYTGGEAPRLSRMGGSDWSNTRNRVRKELAAVAERVVALHKERAMAEGFIYSTDTPWQREFEAAFPYEETPDQLDAIAAIKTDMESDKPMDRLIFGDVGFGKTEVALRAAFKAIQDGKQVAILAPTTLLAQQHHARLEERFEGFPVEVAQLSRLVPARERKKTINRLATGEVDIVVGTHRLLSGDIDIPKLGMLVVDEEQRFGVSAKDRIKEIDASIDVLTLTATPIPRTLEMALTGVRDVSRITTPPQDRQPILTFVGPYEEQAISAAIRRELLREGQVFYVHNRVQSIERAVARIQSLVPHAKVKHAHGRMSEAQLDRTMHEFWNQEFNVLVATTIIESGLDLPQVNTLIVERADMLGLAQLYQLRGRVGRSDRRAYAYLFHPPDERLTDEARRRLRAIGEANDLGAGFQLAMRDLEIRGAGSMLGEVQSGHISAVGFDLYAELVAEAVQELRGLGDDEDEEKEIRIDLAVDAHLPDDYVEDQGARLEAYRTLAAARTNEAVEAVEAEWRDRYGPLPAGALELISMAHLRVVGLAAGLEEIVQVRNEIKMRPFNLSASEEIRLQRLAPRSVLRGTVAYLRAPMTTDELRAFVTEMFA